MQPMIYHVRMTFQPAETLVVSYCCAVFTLVLRGVTKGLVVSVNRWCRRDAAVDSRRKRCYVVKNIYVRRDAPVYGTVANINVKERYIGQRIYSIQCYQFVEGPDKATAI